MHLVNNSQKIEPEICSKCLGHKVILAYKKGVDEQPYAFACDLCPDPSTRNYPVWSKEREKDFEIRKF